MSPDLFFFEAFEEEAAALKACLPPHWQAGYTHHAIQETGFREPPAPIVSIRTQSVLPGEWAGSLRAILTRSTGYDHLLQFAGAGPLCGYLPHYCSRAVAEQALLLWMALLRKLPLQRAHFGSFNRDQLTGREAAGRTLLVAGVGKIGSEVVRIGQGLGMRVLGVDLVERLPDLEYVTPDSGVRQADIIVCSMNLTADNNGYFSYELLKKSRPGLVFVNIARGELSPLSGLKRLLGEGHLAGVGLDVFEDEASLAAALRRGVDHPGAAELLALAQDPRVILTPHNAFNTEEAVARKTEQSVQQLEHLREHGSFLWQVPG